MSISIIIPCYNSEKYILKNIEKLRRHIKKINYKYEIIIIDDCSNDKTYGAIKKISNKYNNIKVYKNYLNEGKSYSLIKGIKKTKFKKIIIVDSDLPYFSRLTILIQKLNNYDFVLINRGHKKSKNIGKNLNYYQIIRSVIGYIVNLIIRTSFSIKIKDTQAGLKGFIKPKNFSKFKFFSKRFFFDLELLLYFISQKKKIFSIPVLFKVPENSSIKIFDLKKNFEVIKELVIICLKKNINEKTNN